MPRLSRAATSASSPAVRAGSGSGGASATGSGSGGASATGSGSGGASAAGSGSGWEVPRRRVPGRARARGPACAGTPGGSERTPRPGAGGRGRPGRAPRRSPVRARARGLRDGRRFGLGLLDGSTAAGSGSGSGSSTTTAAGSGSGSSASGPAGGGASSLTVRVTRVPHPDDSSRTVPLAAAPSQATAVSGSSLVMRISPNAPRCRASDAASLHSAHSSGADLTSVRLLWCSVMTSGFARAHATPPAVPRLACAAPGAAV